MIVIISDRILFITFPGRRQFCQAKVYAFHYYLNFIYRDLNNKVMV